MRVGDVPLNPLGASWGPDDTIIAAVRSAGLMRLPAGGGEAAVVVKPDDAREYWYPQILPSGRAVLFTASLPAADAGDVLALNLTTMEQKTVIRGGVAGWYAPTGHVVFVRGGDLWAVRFDVNRLEASGEPVVVEQGIRVDPGGIVQVTIADDGTLAYLPTGAGTQTATLVWVDRKGREDAIAAPARAYMYPRISPDGTKVALDVRDQENDIWTWDLARATFTRLTSDPGLDRYPVWTPDGRRIAFSSSRAGASNLFWQAADGTGSIERLTEGAIAQFPTSFSPDGTRLLFWQDPGSTSRDVDILPLEGDRRATPLVQTSFSEQSAEVSPDGRWLAYESNESGRPEVYVRPFPKVDEGRWQVSTGGGTRPLWARNGRELFYLVGSGRMMAVPLQPGPTFAAGTPQVVFDGPYIAPQTGRTYDVSSDGQRFLMIKGNETTSTRWEIILVQNWFEELKRLVPTN